MADSRLRVGGFTSTKTFAKTDAEVAQILRWMLADKVGEEPTELTQAELNQWRLEQAHDEIIRYVRQEAMKNRRRELLAAQDVDEQAAVDVSL